MKRVALLVAAVLLLLLAWSLFGSQQDHARSSRGERPLHVRAGRSAAPPAEPLADPGPIPGPSADHVLAEPVDAPRARVKGASRPDGYTLVRGRVIDGRTRVPVSRALGLGVVFRVESEEYSELGERREELDVRLGPGGAFEVKARDPERLLARVVEWETSTVLEAGGLHRYALERTAGGLWLLPVHVGWFARLVPEAGEELVVTSVRLSDEASFADQSWPRMSLSARVRPFALYRTGYEPVPAARRWMDVAARGPQGEEWRARVEVACENGIVPEPIRFRLARRTCASGRVVDEVGRAWSGASVQLMPLGGELGELDFEDLWQATDDSGAFEFCDLLPGTMRVLVSAPFTPSSEEQFRLVEGPNDLGMLVLPRGEGRYELEGELVAGDDGPKDPLALLMLRSRANKLEFVTIAGFELFSEPDGKAGFGFPEVPGGSYELTLQALDGRVYPGMPRAIEVPCEKLVIEARAKRLERIELVCRNARTGESIEADTVFFRDAGHWIPVMGSEGGLYGQIDVLLVWAAGFAPVRVDSPTARRCADGELALEVDLEPGWGRIVFVRDLSASALAGQEGDVAAWFGPPLAFVSVLGERGELARTDETGMALVRAEGHQEKLRVAAPGYRNLSAEVEGGAVLLLVERER